MRALCPCSLAGQIPASKKPHVQLSCGEKHFGICRTRNHSIYSVLMTTGKRVTDLMKSNSLKDSFVQFWSASADGNRVGAVVTALCVVVRARDPKIALFVQHDLVDGHVVPTMRTPHRLSVRCR